MKKHKFTIIEKEIWKGQSEKVIFGKLEPLLDQKPKVPNLFQCVGEKLPFECLSTVEKNLKERKLKKTGVYMAHDSFGVPRYGGRGNIFERLLKHKKKYPKLLLYFSFYIVRKKNHEREIENVILRAAGPQMLLNVRKVRKYAEPGLVTDYEPGTFFYRRWPPEKAEL